jgi:hypothetical protein
MIRPGAPEVDRMIRPGLNLSFSAMCEMDFFSWLYDVTIGLFCVDFEKLKKADDKYTYQYVRRAFRFFYVIIWVTFLSFCSLFVPMANLLKAFLILICSFNVFTTICTLGIIVYMTL